MGAACSLEMVVSIAALAAARVTGMPADCLSARQASLCYGST
jgi:hypothetical protein